MDELQMATANRLLAVLAEFKALKGERVAAWDDVIVYHNAEKGVLASGVQRHDSPSGPQYLGTYEIISAYGIDIPCPGFSRNFTFKVGEL